MTTEVEQSEREEPASRGGPSVFISYRWDDTGDVAEKLDRWLREDLDSRNVFRDRHDLAIGQRLEELLEQLSSADAALCLVGSGWVVAVDEDGRKADGETDWVHAEVKHALTDPNAADPIALLVDIEKPPENPPSKLAGLFAKDKLIYAVDRSHLESARGPSYEHILVGIWEVLRRQVPGGRIVIGERGKEAALDGLIREMRHSVKADVREISRFRGGSADHLSVQPPAGATGAQGRDHLRRRREPQPADPAPDRSRRTAPRCLSRSGGPGCPCRRHDSRRRVDQGGWHVGDLHEFVGRRSNDGFAGDAGRRVDRIDNFSEGGCCSRSCRDCAPRGRRYSPMAGRRRHIVRGRHHARSHAGRGRRLLPGW